MDQNRQNVNRGERHEVKLYSAQSFSDSLLGRIPLPILLLDDMGRVCQANMAARTELAGISEGSSHLGPSLHCIQSAAAPGGCGSSDQCQACSLRSLISNTLKTGQPCRQVEVKIASRRGPQQGDSYLLVSTAAVEWPQGCRVLVCLEDITPIKHAELGLQKALDEVKTLKDQLQNENRSLREQIKTTYASDQIVGKSRELKLTVRKAEYAAATEASVLITGETGTGKELFARLIHRRSARGEGRLVTVNCAALPGTLIESELFGHVAGAFTGALSDKVGRFELADGGTLFLDEIAELPLELQPKLLRVLEQGQFERVGSSRTESVDVRIVAATNRDLQQEVAKGTFRSDLYYRLAVFPVEVPPLRARRSDVPLLAWHFATQAQARLGKEFTSIPEDDMTQLTEYDWPGNIRELQNIMERSAVLSPAPVLQLHETLNRTGARHEKHLGDQDILSVERTHIGRVLEQCSWKINGDGNAAERLCLKPSTLRSRMKKLGIKRPRTPK